MPEDTVQPAVCLRPGKVWAVGMLAPGSNAESIRAGRCLPLYVGLEYVKLKTSHLRPASRTQDLETEPARMCEAIALLTRGADRLEAELAALNREVAAIEERLKKLSESSASP